MIREICKDLPIAQDLLETLIARHGGGPWRSAGPDGNSDCPQGWLRGHGGKHDRREQAHHRF